MNLAMPELGRVPFRRLIFDIKKKNTRSYFCCLIVFYCFKVCLVLCRGSEATRETYRNPKKPCSLCVFIGNSAMFIEKSGQQQGSDGDPLLGC